MSGRLLLLMQLQSRQPHREGMVAQQGAQGVRPRVGRRQVRAACLLVDAFGEQGRHAPFSLNVQVVRRPLQAP
ncbi:hypothetical protein CTI14_57395 [Methylobacterium radiotolerans]|nr:hypothetical protein CTI14_57395 [Methylobacterium radiotolerans]